MYKDIGKTYIKISSQKIFLNFVQKFDKRAYNNKKCINLIQMRTQLRNSNLQIIFSLKNCII